MKASGFNHQRAVGADNKRLPLARESGMTQANFNSTSESASLLLPIAFREDSVLDPSSVDNFSVGDSWVDTFVQRSEVELASQFREVISKETSSNAIANVIAQNASASESADPITGLAIATSSNHLPAYPGYLLSYTPGRSLESRPAVAQWQTQMQQRGWRIEVDGRFGPQSDRIARQFQQEKGLTVDGIVGPETWRVTFDNSTITGIAQPPQTPPTSVDMPTFSGELIAYSALSSLRYDSEVQAFQQRLQDLGWRIEADGLFGVRSASATRAFQQQMGLDADGVVGALTWAAVFSENAPAAPVEQTFIQPGGVRFINEAGLNLIKDFEGLRLNAYQDAVGVWTIGYGHTRTAYPGQYVSEAGATALLREDIATFERAVSSAVQVPLTDNQYAALVSFAFNVGSGALNSSTLLRRLNSGDYYGAANELLRWNRAGGRELYGLTRRREAERSLFLA